MVEDDGYPMIGPGSKKAINWIFNLHQNSQIIPAFQQLFTDMGDLFTKAEDLENGLCEFHKYCEASLYYHW